MMREIPIEKNDDIEFTIDALGSEGQGIGRVDGYTVFVPLALPGEKDTRPRNKDYLGLRRGKAYRGDGTV